MLHLYRMYKFVKLVDMENDKLVKRAMLELKNGNLAVADTFELVQETPTVQQLSDQRVLFRKIGLTRAAQACMTALKSEYLERIPSKSIKGENYLRVTHLKGLPLIDGIPFIRPGLWKIWYQEHGWLLGLLPGSIAIAGLAYLANHLRSIF